MSRINVVSTTAANEEQRALLDAIQVQLGMVPNFLRVFANSPTALRAFLGLHGIANGGSLDAATRERIALALAQQNSCEYCVSAHTAIGRKAGLSSDEVLAARAGTSSDARAAAAVRFARKVAAKLGDVSASDLLEVRAAGFDDADIVEIITHTAMNILTNMIGKASKVTIDFPKVDLELAA